MDYKKENLKLLINLILLIVSILIFIGFLAWNHFSNGYFRDWIGLMCSLAGSLISAFIAMSGIILTLNRNISDKEKEEKEMLRTHAFILKSEIEAYTESIKKCIKNSFRFKVYELNVDGADEHIDFSELGFEDEELMFKNTSFENWVNVSMMFEDIYFLEESLKEKFYNLISKIERTDKEEIIKKFVELYVNNDKLKKICSSKKDKPNDILEQLILSNSTAKVNGIKYNVFYMVDFCKDELKEKSINNEKLKYAIANIRDSLEELYEENLLIQDYYDLIDFFNEVSD